jgi:hypothetical protein
MSDHDPEGEPVEVAGFEMGQAPAVDASQAQHDYRLKLSDRQGSGFRRDPWEIEVLDMDPAHRRVIIRYDSVEVIHVDGPPEIVVRMLDLGPEGEQ